MTLSFRLARRCILATLSLIYMTCLGLSLGIRNHVLHGNFMFVVAFVSAMGLIGCSYMLMKKRFSQGRPQVVGYETTVSFTLLPFEFVIILILLPIKPDPVAAKGVGSILLALQILVYIKSAIWGSYAAFLIMVSTIVALKFDKLVWFRDIDESPSPFPPSVVLSSLFPCWYNGNMLPPSSSAFDHDAHRTQAANPAHICLSGCSCPSKQLLAPQTTELAPVSTDSSATPSDTYSLTSKLLKDEDLPEHKVASSSSLSRSLVRVPNDYERRCSIEVALPVR